MRGDRGPWAIAGSSWVSGRLDRGQYGGLAQRERVAAGRHAEHAPVFAAELQTMSLGPATFGVGIRPSPQPE
jgi:hypothetical protein